MSDDDDWDWAGPAPATSTSASQPRQSGTSTPASQPRQSGKSWHSLVTNPLKDVDQLDRILMAAGHGTVVVWKSRRLFTYAAVFVNDTWYITGTGTFYGKNEFSHTEFVYDVLNHPEVTEIRLAVKFNTLYGS